MSNVNFILKESRADAYWAYLLAVSNSPGWKAYLGCVVIALLVAVVWILKDPDGGDAWQLFVVATVGMIAGPAIAIKRKVEKSLLHLDVSLAFGCCIDEAGVHFSRESHCFSLLWRDVERATVLRGYLLLHTQQYGLISVALKTLTGAERHAVKEFSELAGVRRP